MVILIYAFDEDNHQADPAFLPGASFVVVIIMSSKNKPPAKKAGGLFFYSEGWKW